MAVVVPHRRMVRIAFILLLAFHAVSAQVENLENAAEKHELAEVDNALEDMDEGERATAAMWGNFKQLVDSYLAENKRLVEKNVVLSRTLDDARLGVKTSEPITYHMIPNFVFKTAAMPMKQEVTIEGCHVACNQQFTCKSFSWNKETNECLLSTTTVKYDPESVMYLKKQRGESDPDDAYHAVPGLVGDGASADAMPGTSFRECKYTCTQAKDQCKAFVYFARTKTCATVGDDISFDNNWTFGEKENLEIDNSHETNRVDKENEFKKKIQLVWAKQNADQIKREGKVKKEIKEKCAYDKTAAEGLNIKKEAAHKNFVKDKSRYTELLAQVTKTRNLVQEATEGYLRFKTRALKAQLHKEGKQKEGQKITNPKQVKAIYTALEEYASEEAAAATERDRFAQEVENHKAANIKLQQQRERLQERYSKHSEEEKTWDAKYTVAHAGYLERCEVESVDENKAKLAQAVEAAKEKRAIAVEEERKAKGLQEVAEAANKKLVVEKDSGDREALTKSAFAAGADADKANAIAKKATKDELAATVTKDKLQAVVAETASKAAAFKKKLVGAKAFLAALEKAKKTADQEEEEAQEAP